MNNELIWHNETRKISELIKYPKNPRHLTEKQYNDLKQSLEKFNLVETPAINLDNKIISGHMRLKILSILNNQDYIVDVRCPSRLLTEKEFEELNIRFNKNRGEWDFDILANEFDLEKLKDWGFTDRELHLEGFDIPKDNWKDEWQNMPDFEHEDLEGYKQIKVSFQTKEDMDNFSVLINQKITDKTRSIWFPKAEVMSEKDKIYTNSNNG